MTAYIFRRVLLIIPTLWAIVTLNFFIVQAVPGGPVEQMIAKLSGHSTDGLERITNTQQDLQKQKKAHTTQNKSSGYLAAQGIDPVILAEIKKMYGFDQPITTRYFHMLWKYLRFDLGDSFYREVSVIELVKEKLPVSISLGLWSTLIVYLISIPLGIRKAIKHGSRFDVTTSTVIILGNAIPSFLFAVLMIILFAGGSYLQWFPLRGLVSDNFADLSWGGKILDYFWHLTLPILSIIIGSFATLTMLTKNSFLDEINKQYVITARAKGLSENKILYKHVFRNSMLIIISGFPAAFISIFFTGAILVEIIFSLDGLGLLGYQAAIQRDFPVMFGTLYIFTLLGLIVSIISDLTYMFIDKRIDFETRGT